MAITFKQDCMELIVTLEDNDQCYNNMKDLFTKALKEAPQNLEYGEAIERFEKNWWDRWETVVCSFEDYLYGMVVAAIDSNNPNIPAQPIQQYIKDCFKYYCEGGWYPIDTNDISNCWREDIIESVEYYRNHHK